MKKANKKKIAYNIILAVLICIFVGCAGYLAVYFLQSRRSEKQFQELEALIEEDDASAYDSAVSAEDGKAPDVTFVEVDGVQVQSRMAAIYRENHDFVGWLSIEDTKISYPVMLTPEEEEYYIRRDFYGEPSSSGTIFADTESDIRTPGDNVLLYGHNMKTGTMFHDLLKYEDAAFYNNHKYIQFDTIYGDGTYEVIAAFRTKIPADNETAFRYYRFFHAEDAAQFEDYVKSCKERTPYEIQTTADYGDALLTLSTCAYHTDNGRFVVVAKRIAP